MSTTSQAVLSPESDSESGYACDKSAEAFRTIGEAAGELGLKTHVLLFWETKFDNLRLSRRAHPAHLWRHRDSNR